MLISRVYCDATEIDYAAGPLRRDERGDWYQDFYKVVTDLEVLYEWKLTLVSFKNSFWDFHRDILIAHHYFYALLRHFGFIIDVEAVDLYPENIGVVYSYRRSSFKHSQSFHRTGVAFVQLGRFRDSCS